MKRIDSINARPDANGTGKVGFSDNADLSGQDATYLTPEWLNHLQEEICNLIELNGVALNAESKQQLFDLLTTQSELVALSDAIESNFIRKSQKGVANGVTPLNAQSIIDSSFLPISSLLKAGIVQLVNDLTTGGIDKALTAEMGKQLQAFNALFVSSKSQNGYMKLAQSDGTVMILQFGLTGTISDEGTLAISFPISFPNQCLNVQLTENKLSTSAANAAHVAATEVTKNGFNLRYNSSAVTSTFAFFFAVGY